MKKQRIFIAVNLPNKIKVNLKQSILAKCLCIVPLGENCPVKWVEPGNWHLTMKFLGYIESEKLNIVEEILKEKTAYFKPFSIELKKFGFFPEKGTPKVLWIGIEKGYKVLEQLAKLLEHSFAGKGFRKEEREGFVCHITLGRVKKHLKKEEKENLLKLKDDLKNKLIGKFKVLSIDIMESKLSPKGPKYSVIKQIKLK